MQKVLETLQNIAVHLAACQELTVVEPKAIIKEQLDIGTK